MKKKTNKTKAKAKTAAKPRAKKAQGGVKSSSKEEFLKKVRKHNSMIEYITNLRIMNPAAQIQSQLNTPQREGGFIRLAHAREEFTAPVLSKGKAALRKQKKSSKQS